jgi:hypothetical protein
MRAVAWAAGAALLGVGLVGGCEQRQSIAAGDPQPKAQERTIDWQAAEKAPQMERPGGPLAQAAAATAEDAAAIASPVPVLAPPPSVSAAAAGLDAEPAIRPTPDGYFAVYPGPKYDMSVHGTKAFTAAPATAPQAPAVEPAAGGYRFEVGEGQAQIAFSRFGADYLIEFQCKGDLTRPCIDETEAIAMAEKLLVVGRP